MWFLLHGFLEMCSLRISQKSSGFERERPFRDLQYDALINGLPYLFSLTAADNVAWRDILAWYLVAKWYICSDGYDMP